MSLQGIGIELKEQTKTIDDRRETDYLRAAISRAAANNANLAMTP